MDVSKLTPLPLEIVRGMAPGSYDCAEVRTIPPLKRGKRTGEYGQTVGHFGHRRTDAEFYLLARQAFDVMMRRGWYAYPALLVGSQAWRVAGLSMPDDREMDRLGLFFSDPFTALVEADKWYALNIED